jgi:enamine deaminase RidA (YjgF/YER057c/UK114 family)
LLRISPRRLFSKEDDPVTHRIHWLCEEDIESVLAQHRWTVENVLQVTFYLVDMNAYEQVNESGTDVSYVSFFRRK